MRRLILVPVVHTLADLGSAAESVRARYEKQFGPAGWQQRESAVGRLWSSIRKKVEDLRLDYRTVRIYQDGLPVCGQELQIVRELAGAGSLNHQLVLDLMQRGAILMGTEDPQLLIREYHMHRGHLAGADPGGEPTSFRPNEAASLLEARDRYIAQRIAGTLQEGETGLVFLGALHRLDALRHFDIEVETLA
jgi:hypothetical protein